MLVMRDYHALRRQSAVEPWDCMVDQDSLFVCDRMQTDVTLLLSSGQRDGVAAARYEHKPVWWYNFRYREELARGFPGGEDLLCSGAFVAEAKGKLRVEIDALAFAPERPAAPRHKAVVRRASAQRRGHNGVPPQPSAADGSEVARRLSIAAEQFIVARHGDDAERATILAGYHWFGDWGRDAFISLEGLLLVRQRFDEAKQVLLTFASAQRDGLIPNRFSDYGEDCEYNSVDASLWFIHAADAYVTATGDQRIWSTSLAEPCRAVVEAFLTGTRFNIHVDENGLIDSGDPSTQITWMDAKVGDYVCTPRHGRPVEVNALWYHALCILARRCNKTAARRYAQLAAQVAAVFADTFWNEHEQCLCDVVRNDGKDFAVRPNQIFAASLPDTMLTDRQARHVLDAVRLHLLTPLGLRTLSNRDSRYIPHYVGDSFARDRAYHNGTVWAWLMGPYVDAHLRVHAATPEARRRGLELLQPLIDHLDEAGLGSVSEIFDGDPPHTPRGCIAQAWSVAEVLRSYHRLTS
jgi:predicted glycogen debranching enzyme